MKIIPLSLIILTVLLCIFQVPAIAETTESNTEVTISEPVLDSQTNDESDAPSESLFNQFQNVVSNVWAALTGFVRKLVDPLFSLYQ